MADGSQIEDDLYVAVSPGGAGGGDRLPVLPQSEARPYQGLQLYPWRDAERQLEALHPLALVLFDGVGVGAGELYFLVPEGGEIQAAPRGRHPDERHLPAGTRQARRVLDGFRGADALEDLVRPAHHDGL